MRGSKLLIAASDLNRVRESRSRFYAYSRLAGSTSPPQSADSCTKREYRRFHLGQVGRPSARATPGAEGEEEGGA